MFVWVLEPWPSIVVEADLCRFSEGLGPILRIYDERFHLPNRVIKFPFKICLFLATGQPTIDFVCF